MSSVRQYELIYIVPPETTDEALAELQTQVEAITQRFRRDHRENRETGAAASLPTKSASTATACTCCTVINGRPSS
jgi:hypothetical protein